MMKRLFYIFGLITFIPISSAQILQINFSGVLRSSGYTGDFGEPEPCEWNLVTGIMTYDTDLLSNEEFTQEGDYWRWQYQTVEGFSLYVTLSNSNPSSTQQVSYSNASDYPYGQLMRYTAFENVYATFPSGYYDVKQDEFELVCDDQQTHIGIVNSIEVIFSASRAWMSSLPLEPYEPQVIFDPDYYKSSTGIRPDYGNFILTTIDYNENSEIVSLARHFFVIESAEVIAIPEPTTLLLLGLGGLLIRRK